MVLPISSKKCFDRHSKNAILKENIKYFTRSVKDGEY